jgi:hypothetical protein
MNGVFNLFRKCSGAVAIVCAALALSSCELATQTKQQQSLDALVLLSQDLKLQQQRLEQLQEQITSLSVQQERYVNDVTATLQKLNAHAAESKAAAREGSRRSLSVDASAKDSTALGMDVLGRVEWLWLSEQQRFFAAELDSALDTSIIYASDVMRFERDGQPWVSFTLRRNDWPSRVETKMIQAGRQYYLGERPSIKGYRVRLPVALGKFNDMSEFLLVERHRDYPQIVLGKNFLTDVAVVDVSRKYIVKRSAGRTEQEALRRKLYMDSLTPKATLSSNSDSDAIVTP